MIKMPPEKLSKDDMAGFEEEEEDDLPLPILKRKNVSRIKLYGFLAFRSFMPFRGFLGHVRSLGP